MKQRIAVALSGGVDSAVAAALLKNQGNEIIGVTLRLFKQNSSANSRCSEPGLGDAKAVARHLGIPHYVFDVSSEFSKYIIGNFASEYLKCRTPNPCVRCNAYIKFGVLLKKIRSLGADRLATGHYANIKETPGGYELSKARDKTKDQSYFLYRLKQSQLKNILFPLAGYAKEQVRRLAGKFKLPVADKADSQEICFLPAGDYRDFLTAKYAARLIPGRIKDKCGRLLGQHRGLAFYTIGQREGLGISLGYPAYVTGLDYGRNELYVGKRQDACKREFIVSPVYFVLTPVKNKVVLKIRVRYNQKEQLAVIRPSAKNSLRVTFKNRQFAITCGQSAVFYKGDTIIGGGVIQKVIC